MHHKEKRIPLAEIVIRAFGGEGRGAKTRTAKALDLTLTEVCKWSAPRSKKGTDGDIPRWLKPRLLELAESQNLDITPKDLVLGYRKVSA